MSTKTQWVRNWAKRYGDSAMGCLELTAKEMSHTCLVLEELLKEADRIEEADRVPTTKATKAVKEELTRLPKDLVDRMSASYESRSELRMFLEHNLREQEKHPQQAAWTRAMGLGKAWIEERLTNNIEYVVDTVGLQLDSRHDVIALVMNGRYQGLQLESASIKYLTDFIKPRYDIRLSLLREKRRE